MSSASSTSAVPLEDDAASAGFQAFLRKPFGMDALLRELARLLPPEQGPMLLA